MHFLDNFPNITCVTLKSVTLVMLSLSFATWVSLSSCHAYFWKFSNLNLCDYDESAAGHYAIMVVIFQTKPE
jgi:hypothetical protein